MSRVALTLLLCLLAAPARAGGPALRLELLTGLPANLSTGLHVEQRGQPDLEFDAEYASEPFRQPLFWALRLSRERGEREWSLELMHHKLILENPPAEVQSFTITHGFNLLTLQRAWPLRGLRARAGLGLVITHPESEIRGRKWDESRGILGTGYRLSGGAATVGLGRRVPLGARVSLLVEGRATVAPAWVPVAEGDARLTNVSFHLLLGVAAGL